VERSKHRRRGLSLSGSEPDEQLLFERLQKRGKEPTSLWVGSKRRLLPGERGSGDYKKRREGSGGEKKRARGKKAALLARGGITSFTSHVPRKHVEINSEATRGATWEEGRAPRRPRREPLFLLPDGVRLESERETGKGNLNQLKERKTREISWGNGKVLELRREEKKEVWNWGGRK